MRVVKLEVKNYRTLQNICVNFTSDYCAISRKNNAGKSAIIKLLINLLKQQEPHPWFYEDTLFEYKDDVTQWVSKDSVITVICYLCLTRDHDPALINFIEKQAEISLPENKTSLDLSLKLNAANELGINIIINGSILVEGDTDKKYFDYLRNKYKADFGIPNEIEIIPYGGKDTLKNSMLLKFVLSRFDKAFITFDLDAKSEVERVLNSLGLQESVSYISVGLNKPGREAIEGLLPDRVISAVINREIDLVMQLGSKNPEDRKSAKNQLKKKYLDEFTNHDDYSEDELKSIFKIGKLIGKYYS